MSKTSTPSRLGDLEFLCTIDRKTTYSYTVPQYAMCDESNTGTVRVVKNPVEIKLTIFESTTPVTWKNKVSDDGDRLNRVKYVKETLTDMYLSNELYTLTTPNDMFENMAISSLTLPEDDYLNAMEIAISLKQVVATENQYETLDYTYSVSWNATSTTTTETIATEKNAFYTPWYKKLGKALSKAINDVVDFFTFWD